MIQLSSLHRHPQNPRTINDSEFDRLVRSLTEFPKMMTVQRIAYDEDGTIWSGNQRYDALIKIGYTEIPDEWTDNLSGWTEDEKKQYAIRANDSSGEWDYEALKSEYWADVNIEEYSADIAKHLNALKHDWDDLDYVQGDQQNPLDKDQVIKIIIPAAHMPDIREIENDIKALLTDKWSGCEVK